ncbi:MAG TPA: glycosyltransferase family 2 protein [Syntrophobacteraceae bacterium]|nr:glycosyltransferase family 2 protein [Syntrophobacteraceae bacterium]
MVLSVVIPVYGCRDCLEELHRRLVDSLEAITPDFEIILVNDACPQNSWETIREIALKNRRVKGLDLSRNFGQIRAITAGLHNAKGEWIVVMDCDLQDRPEEIHRLYAKALEGYDLVYSRRTARRDTFLKKIFSRMFHAIYGYFTGGVFDSSISNFSICRRVVAENYKRMGDCNRAYILFLRWMGFKSAVIDIERSERSSGKSSYTLRKQLRLASEIITTQSNKPLIWSFWIGCVLIFISFIYGLTIIYRHFVNGAGITASMGMIACICFIGGIVIAQLGVIGYYLGNVFDQTKGRPLYIVRETVEFESSRPGESL